MYIWLLAGPVSGQLVSGSGAAGGVEGGRAVAIAGAMLGVLLFSSSLVWALYKFKPGLIPLGGGGAKSSAMNISSPRATTNYQLVKSQALGAGGGYGRAAASSSTLSSGVANGAVIMAAPPAVAVAATQTNINASTQTAESGAAFGDYYQVRILV